MGLPNFLRGIGTQKTQGADSSYYSLMRKKIMASMMLVPFFPFIAVVIIGYYYFTASVQNSTIAKMIRIVEDHRQMIESFLAERKADLQLISDTHQFHHISQPQALKEVFGALQKGSKAFVDLGVFNEDGLQVAYCGPYDLAGKTYKEKEWFREVMNKGWFISDVFLGYRNVPHFIVAIAKKEDNEIWVIRATIDTALFNSIVGNVRIGKTGEAYLVNRDGVFQTERRSGGALMERDLDFAKYQTSSEGVKTFNAKDATGTSFLYAITVLADNQWLLVAREEQGEAFETRRTAAYLIVLVTIYGGAVIASLAIYLSGRITRRMELADQEKYRLNQQLIAASRLAEIGEMSAGFAHEINNPLQIMQAEQTLIETILHALKERGDVKQSDDLAELEDSLRQIKIQITRSGKITQALLTFARQKEPVIRKIDLRTFIPETTNMIARRASVEGISIEEDIRADLPYVQGDPSELQQVLINLFNNAIDAIVAKHGSSGGKLKVRAHLKDKRVELSITDNGCGISAGNKEKIFTPFFTTKPVGKGTGLGLSVCFGIVNKMGGIIEVSSEKNKGTTVVVRLPAAA